MCGPTRSGLLAATALAVATLLAACEVPEPPRHISGPIAAPPGCPALPDQLAEIDIGGRPPPTDGVDTAREVTAIDVWGRRATEALDPTSLGRFLATFHHDFDVIAEGRLPTLGMDVEVRSDGPLGVDLAALDRTARTMLTMDYPDPRFAVLVDCYRRRIVSGRELEGRTLRIYVPADPTACFQAGVLTPRGDGGCDAIGFAIPDTQLIPSLARLRPLSLRWPATIVLAPGQHSTHPEPVEQRAAQILVHELMHFFDNEMGLRPHPTALREYEQRAYYVEQVHSRAAARGEIDPGTPVTWRRLMLPETAEDERR